MISIPRFIGYYSQAGANCDVEHQEDSSGVNKDGNIYSQSGEKCLRFD